MIHSKARPTVLSKMGYYLFLSLCLVVTSSAGAEEAATPLAIEGVTSVSAEELIQLAETKPDLIIIDARIEKDRVHGYIQGSVSLPNTTTDCNSLGRVLKSKNTPTVYYCNGPKCGRSAKSIYIAKECGYQNIYWYRGGFEDWENKGYPFVITDR